MIPMNPCSQIKTTEIQKTFLGQVLSDISIFSPCHLFLHKLWCTIFYLIFVLDKHFQNFFYINYFKYSVILLLSLCDKINRILIIEYSYANYRNQKQTAFVLNSDIPLNHVVYMSYFKHFKCVIFVTSNWSLKQILYLEKLPYSLYWLKFFLRQL